MSSDTSTTVESAEALEGVGLDTAGADATTAKGLAANKVSLLGAVTMGVGGCGPAYSLAASLAILVATVGIKSPAVMIISFIPMLMISTAFYSFAHVDPDCGQAFSWTTRGMGPWMGWVLGFWGIAMVIVIAPNIANVVAMYAYLLVGWESGAASTFWLTVGSVVLLGVVMYLIAAGVELSIRTQYVLMALQVGSLILFAAVTIIKPLFVDVPGHVSLSLDMFLPTNMSWSLLASGMLIGVFFYNGWDVSVSAGEESSESPVKRSLAAVLSPVILVALFSLCSAGGLTYQGPDFVASQPADALSAVATGALGSPWDKIVLLAVFTGTFAAAVGMMYYLTRWTLSMGSHGALGRVFAKVDKKRHVPVEATIILGGIMIGIRILLAFLNENLVYDIVPSLALITGISYAFTGFACAIYFRKWLFKTLWNFLSMGLLPVAGGAIIMWVWVKSAIMYWDPAYSYSGGWYGVGAIFWIGMGATLLAFVLVIVAWIFKPEFFKRKAETWPGEGQPIPYQDETVI